MCLVLIPDVSGICSTSPTSCMSHFGRREFQHSSRVLTIIKSSDVSCTADSVMKGQIPDMSGIDTGRVRYCPTVT
jgi:hypothetical protein